MSAELAQIVQILSQAKALAKKYRQLTGKPLGITGEVGEFEVARLLGLDLAIAREPGFDVIRKRGKKVDRIQVKARCLGPEAKRGQRIGGINLKKEWDSVILIIMDEDYIPMVMYEANRPEITEALLKPGSKARNERGALSIEKFRSIGKKIWTHPV